MTDVAAHSALMRGALIVATSVLAISANASGPKSTASARNTDWPVLGRTLDNHHFSPLTQINASNVAQLGLAWYADIPTRDGVVGEPLIADGVVYQSGTPSVAWAHDIRTGKLLWSFDARIKYTGEPIPTWGSRVNRGLALWKDKVYIGTGDCRLVAITRTTGKLAWEADVCGGDGKLSITGAPRVGGGKVFVGPSNGDDGSRRGRVDAFDAETGKHLWRFYTIPGDPSLGFEYPELKEASRTWGEDYWKVAGGGSVWDGIQYDQKLNLLYLGVSSAMPEAPVDRGEGRGDELFAASIVAVNADTGKYVWHFNQTPNNAWNFDATGVFTIVDLDIDGKTRRVLLQAPKNGFFYMLDAATGKFLAGDMYGVRVNWASGLDPVTGRPIELPDARYYERPDHTAVHYPGIIGARTWTAMAFSPLTKLSYVPALDMAGRTVRKPLAEAPQNVEMVGSLVGGVTQAALEDKDIVPDGRTHLVAWDPVARKVRWKVTESLPIFGGVLATAGNLVFAPHGQHLNAFAADTGKKLWSQEVPGGMLAPPVTVIVDGEQLLLVTIGNTGSSGHALTSPSMASTASIRNAPPRLLAFKLGGKAQIPPTDLSDIYPEPPQPRFSPETVARGRESFQRSGCGFCHGGDYLDAAGSVPNLKKASSATHAAFESIVIGGERRSRGMPDYSWLDPATAKDIQAYIIDQAWDAYEAQQTK